MSRRNLIATSARRCAVPMTMAGLFVLASALCVSSAPSGEPGEEGSAPRNAKLDASRVVGHSMCVDCHRAEVAAWYRMKHASKVFDLLLETKAREYAEKLDIAEDDLARNSRCVDCHATRTQDRLGHAKVIAGVSCEACHSPAGGQNGWLNTHAVYGPVGTRREDESQKHYDERASRCQTAGQIRPSDLYLMAKRCLACHLVGDEELVNTAGHKLSGDRFELLKYMSGEVRHNLHLNQRKNEIVSSLWKYDLHHPNRDSNDRMATVYVVGQLVKAETVLRNLAAAEDPEGGYAEDLANLLDATLGALEDIGVDELIDLADDSRDLCDRLLDGDFESGDEEITETAESFAKLAQQYAAGEGEDLNDVELPDIEEELRKAYQP